MNNKPWYEEINVPLTLVANACTIFGASIFGGISIFNIFSPPSEESQTESFSQIVETVTETTTQTNETIPPNDQDNQPIDSFSSANNSTENIPELSNTPQKENDPFPTEPPVISGWVFDESGNWRWKNEDGSYYNGWKQDNNNWYFLKNEIMVTGWDNINGAWYYFFETGCMAKDAWIENYYLGSDGIMYSDTIATVDGITYYFNKSGEANLNSVAGPYPYSDHDNGIGPGYENDDIGPMYNPGDEIRPTSELCFHDCDIFIDEDGEFYLEGYISSNYHIEIIRFYYYTPNLYIEMPFYGCITDVGLLYNLDSLNETVNNVDYDAKWNMEGDYELIIEVEDSFGNEISESFCWYY